MKGNMVSIYPDYTNEAQQECANSGEVKKQLRVLTSDTLSCTPSNRETDKDKTHFFTLPNATWE